MRDKLGRRPLLGAQIWQAPSWLNHIVPAWDSFLLTLWQELGAATFQVLDVVPAAAALLQEPLPVGPDAWHKCGSSCNPRDPSPLYEHTWQSRLKSGTFKSHGFAATLPECLSEYLCCVTSAACGPSMCTCAISFPFAAWRS